MLTIKDKIEIYRSQVESVEEVIEDEKKDDDVDAGAKSQYKAVEDDDIDLIVEKFMQSRDASVPVSRISPGFY